MPATIGSDMSHACEGEFANILSPVEIPWYLCSILFSLWEWNLELNPPTRPTWTKTAQNWRENCRMRCGVTLNDIDLCVKYYKYTVGTWPKTLDLHPGNQFEFILQFEFSLISERQMWLQLAVSVVCKVEHCMLAFQVIIEVSSQIWQ